MNERGEITLLSCLLILGLTGIVFLSTLELQRSFSQLKARTTLLLCTKETKGELNEFLIFMGRTNWGIQNLQRAKWIALIFPGAKLASQSAEKLKKFLQSSQEARLIYHLKILRNLQLKGCPLPLMLLKTPFETNGPILKRNQNGSVKLRSLKWNYHFFVRPYEIHLSVLAREWEKISPQVEYVVEDKPVRFSSLLRAF